MRTINMSKNPITALFLVLICFQLTSQQPTQTINSLPNLNDISSTQTIAFKSDSLQPPAIKTSQAQYSYSPQINEDYSIVHTVIYPDASARNKFVSSIPKDNFVKKLATSQQEKNEQKNPVEQQTKAKQTRETEDKQAQAKAEQILKKQTQEQDTKTPQQNKQKSTTDSMQSKNDEPAAKIEQKVEQKVPQKSQSLQETQRTKSQQPKQKQQSAKPQSPVKPVEQDEAEQNLFARAQTKSHAQIEKTNKEIKFKEHQVSKPLSITNYPFEKSSQIIEDPKPTSGNTQTDNKRKQDEVKSAQNLQKETQMSDKNKQSDTKKVTAQQINPTGPKKKEIIATETEKQKTPVVDESKPKNQAEKQQKLKTPQDSKQISPPSLDSELIEEFNRITESLRMDPQQVKTQLQFENLAREQVEESSRRLLILKIVICATILVAVYQAMCSTQSQQRKVEKGKYSPVEMTELDTEHTLETAQRLDHK